MALTTGVTAGRDRPHQALLGERQEVLDRPAAAREHDDVDGRVAVQPAQGVGHLRDGVGALHRDVLHAELDARPPPAGVLEDVALGGGAAAADQADAPGQERQGPLALGGEQPLGGEGARSCSSRARSAPRPTDLISIATRRQRPAGQVEVRLARARRRGRRRRAVARTASSTRVGQVTRHRHVRDRVAQREEHRRRPRPPVELGHLPLDPHPAEPRHPVPDQAGHRAHGDAAARPTSRAPQVSSLLRRPARAVQRGAYHGCSDRAYDRDPPRRDRRRVLLAAPRGYCAGVDRAVITVEKALDLYGPPVYVRKQIVHNKHVVATLESRVPSSSRRPTRCPRAPSSCSPRTASHRRCTRRPRRAASGPIDATCPLVTKVHHEAKRFAAEGYQILLIGHEGHEEVVGTTGEAPEHITLVDGPAGADAVDVPDPEKIAWLSQTTLSVDETDATVERAARAASPPCSTRRATTSATRRRTVRWR